MHYRTRIALEESIKHWQENVEAEIPDDCAFGTQACGLCRLFFDRATGGGCTGCPVAEFANNDYCQGTPYRAAVDAHTVWKFCPSPSTEAAYRAAAQVELDFLLSLHPNRNEA